jgi:hypothetical protein
MAQVTYARKSLLAILQRTHARDVAARCRVHPAQVTRWIEGTAEPSARARAALWVNYGISPRAWSARWTPHC